MENSEETRYNFKGLFKYISTVISWTIFVLLCIVGILLLYYFISMRLYTTKGEKYEPKFSVYTIASGSMEPTIKIDDVIINTRVDNPEDININDVITFVSTWQVNYGMTVTHRIVGTQTLDDGSLCYVTRGDNNTQEDQSCVKKSNIIGVVKAVIPGLGKIQKLLASGLGWILIIIIPALYILTKDIIKIFNLVNTPEEEIAKNSKSSKNKYLQKAYEDLVNVKNKKKSVLRSEK